MAVFGRVSIPSVPNGYRKKGEDGTVQEFDRRLGYLELAINPLVAKVAFDMSGGYINHLKLIARYATRKSTPRIYLHLLRSASQNKMTIRTPLFDLKDYLGLVEYDKENGQVTNVQYSKFSQFKQRVLDSAKEDLERMSQLNQTDIIFKYRPIYRTNCHRGDPAYVEFSITKTPLGNARDMMLHRDSSEIKLINKIVEKCPDIKKEKLINIIKKVPQDYYFDFVDYAYKEIWYLVERKQPDDVAAYILRLLNNWIKKKDQEEKKRQESEREHYVTPDLFGSNQEDSQPEVEPNANFDLWNLALQNYEGPIKHILQNATYLGMLGMMFAVQVSKEDQDIINSQAKELQKFNQVGRKILGRENSLAPALKIM